MSDELKGKVAIVTGGGRGIGKAITHSLAAAGADVAIASRKLETLEATAREMEALPGRILPVACHVGRKEQLEELVRQTEDTLGGVDILVNNSATNVAQGPSLEVTDEAFDKMIEVNVKSCLRLMRLTVPKMIERGGGVIINITSIAGLNPQPYGAAYSFTKAGLNMLTRSWAREFGPLGIRVNAIAPGPFHSDGAKANLWPDEATETRMRESIPWKRFAKRDEVAAQCLNLLAPISDYITGECLVMDGGLTLSAGRMWEPGERLERRPRRNP